MPLFVRCECVVCGGVFLRLPCRVRQGKDRFCSPECAKIGQRRASGSRWLAPQVRFAEHVLDDDPNGCLMWRGQLNDHGYGVFEMRVVMPDGRIHRETLAHRAAWTLANGPIPNGLKVRHVVCRTPACVRVSHLMVGTQADNMADMVADGSKKGERHHMARLTTEQALAIRHAYANGGLTEQQLAVAHGVSRGTINSLLRRQSWAHV